MLEPEVVKCPTCGAAPSEPCKRVDSGGAIVRRWETHKRRIKAAEKAATRKPPAGDSK